MPAKCQQQQVGSSVNGTRERLSEYKPPSAIFLECLEIISRSFLYKEGEEQRMNQFEMSKYCTVRKMSSILRKMYNQD